MDRKSMNLIENAINQICPGIGYACFLFDINSPEYASYFTNVRKRDFIKSMKVSIQYFEEQDIFLDDDMININGYGFLKG